MTMRQFVVFLMLFVLNVPVAFSGRIYIWVDKSGNTQFTDYPPPEQEVQDLQTPHKEVESQTLSGTTVTNSGQSNSPVLAPLSRPDSPVVTSVQPPVTSMPPQFKNTSSTFPTDIELYEFYKAQLERDACPSFARGSREWSNCRAEVKKYYGEVCRDDKRQLEKNLRQAYCALADYMTVIELR